MATIKEKLDWAFENQDKDSVAKEYVTRYRKGLLNPELTKEGMQPVELPKPKVDMTKIMAIPQEEGRMTEMPESSEISKDVSEFYDSLGKTTEKTVEGVKEIAQDDDFTTAQKGMGILGKLAGGVSGAIGDIAIGVGKLVLTQNAENKVKEITQNIAQGVAETETAKNLVEWYGGLNKQDKLVVDSLGGMSALMADVFAGGMVGKSAKPITDATKKTAVAVKEGGEAIVNKIDDIFTPTQASLESKIQSYFEKGVKPNLQGQQTLGQAEKYRDSIVTATKVIDKNKENLQFADDMGEAITGRTPKSLQELSEAIDQTKKQIYTEYDNLATQAGDAGVRIDAIKIANQLDEVINNKALKVSNPEAVKYAEEVRNRFIKAGDLDAKTAQEIIQNYNNSLKAFYKNPTYENASRSGIDALMANQLRQALDEGIEGLTGAEYQSLKSQYGALKTIERDVLRATLRDARKNVKGLIDYTDVFSGGQLVSGLLTLNPALISSGIVQKAIAVYTKFRNNPNRAIDNMFETASKLDKDPNITPIPTRKQIDAPEEGASDQSIYTPLELGPRSQSTIDATERMNPNIKDPSFNMGEIPTTKGTQSLLEEAKKYKSAEEFVKAKGEPLFHATRDEKMTAFDKNYDYEGHTSRTDVGQVRDYETPYGKVFLTNNLREAKAYGQNVLEVFYDGKPKIKTIKTGDVPPSQYFDNEYNWGKLADIVENANYDILKLVDNNGKATYLTYPEKLLTKSQLTDIWKEANGKP